MGHKRSRRGSTGQGLQHRGLDLEKPAPFQSVANRPYDGDALAGHRACLWAHDQVDVALADPGFLAHLLVRHRQRPQGLGCHLPGVGQHRQLAASGADDLAAHEDDVAEVHRGLPGVQRFLAHAGEADHGLQLGAIALLQGGETELAGVAGENHPPGDADDLAGGGVGRQVRMSGADFGQGVGARDRNRVGLVTLVEQALTFALPDAELLGYVGAVRVGIQLTGVRSVRIAHGESA